MKWRSLEESPADSGYRPLAEVYAERKQLIAKYVPADVQGVHSRVIEDLRSSGAASRALQVGQAAPSFELADQNGKFWRSSELVGPHRLVVCFFRGRWCPFCVAQLEALNAIQGDLRAADTLLVAISPQTTHQSFLTVDQHRLTFPLLHDAGNEVGKKFGLVYRVPEYQQEIYRRAFVNLPFLNGDSSWELPIPATFVIDRHSAIVYASANPDYTNRPEPRSIVEFLSQTAA
jgi:peroxiredoxin